MKVRKNRVQVLWASAAYIIIMFAVEVTIASLLNVTSKEKMAVESVHIGRHLLSNHSSSLHTRHKRHGGIHHNCTGRPLDEFPADFMSESDRKNGGVIVHIFIVLYIFGAVAIACDDYFVPALERLSEVLKLQPDVAGATFMAAGSSAPELFTSIIGVFFAKSDVGLGTIVGSAVFNVLFIISICGLFSGMVVHLTWWPLTRDLVFYFISILALVAAISDSAVYWYESSCLLLMYAVYIIIMYYNPKIGNFFITKAANCCKSKKENSEVYRMPDVDPLLPSERAMTTGSHFSQRSVCSRSQCSQRSFHSVFDDDIHEDLASVYSERVGYGTSHKSVLVREDTGEYESPLAFPETACKRIFWLIMLPVHLLYFLTIPDCKRQGCCSKLYVFTFFMSILWTAGLTYLMVWMVTVIGDTMGIPDTVLGLTLLAAGTSVPDALASLLVARDGNGDMAVSNSIGSNIFDLLLCLGLPWILFSTVVQPGQAIKISSKGITGTTLIMFGSVLFLFISIACNRWKLDKKLGVVYMIVYFIVIIFACLFEMNVFSEVNMPPCPR